MKNRIKFKINSKMSITKKLFIITAVVFAVFIGSTLIVQSLFFEKFYIFQKKRDLADIISKFKIEYNKAEDETKVQEIIEEYEINNNIKIVIMDSSYRFKFIARPSNGKMDIARTRDLAEFLTNWVEDYKDEFTKIKESNKTITFMPRTREPAARNILSVSGNNSKGEVIFALSSLQPVNEAVSVIERLYLYFGIVAVFFTVILAFIYSNMIAKPLVKINKVATKMAELDFTEKCEVNSEDEIGNVAASLNFLSENLDNALNSLKQANAKLEEDIEKERKLEKMRREFVAAVSHELKTPISLIDGYAVGLKDNIFEDKDKDYYLDVIIDEAEKMGNLVSDMLDLSYLESGSFKLTRQEFNLTELIEQTLRKYDTLINEKGAAFKINLIEEIKVFADWNRLEQVLTNFITNAIRHVNEGGTIYISAVDIKDTVSIEVENTGSSISEEELSRIWDKFYKIDKSRNRKLGGTGIGLSIVKNILVHHGYPYGVKNTEKGVKFYFKVPKYL
ncbi:HAMP domain-containing histidine kinase [Clostridium sp. SYSU_GA19001]|uniref:sensor histidine kinase n=1 Tax=Clostridium caldaquaticum TaxID=2940653 RepID=UPI0020770EAE|nr:sensor histidine kinase [Clostridium caldaquaticum]MCM8712060.1 HAMP domain-containing histidine kinase [Clostridium caldaquaticum]